VSLAQTLAVVGAAFEIAGFSWVIADASAALSREYGEHGPFRRVILWLRYWLGPPPQPITASGSANLSFGTRLNITGHKANETDIERLEQELANLRRDLDEHKKATEQRFSDLEGRLGEAEQRLTERADQIEQQLSELRRRTLHRERRGARVFMFGIVLTLASALVTPG
jgi:hypothetical protein